MRRLVRMFRSLVAGALFSAGFFLAIGLAQHWST